MRLSATAERHHCQLQGTHIYKKVRNVRGEYLLENVPGGNRTCIYRCPHGQQIEIGLRLSLLDYCSCKGKAMSSQCACSPPQTRASELLHECKHRHPLATCSTTPAAAAARHPPGKARKSQMPPHNDIIHGNKHPAHDQATDSMSASLLAASSTAQSAT
jgi:hypothetical protein